MNTTEHILLLGTQIDESSDLGWKLAIHRHNPLCGHWWMQIMENNPGGQLVTHNPDQWDELMANLITDYGKYNGGCGALD